MRATCTDEMAIAKCFLVLEHMFMNSNSPGRSGVLALRIAALLSECLSIPWGVIPFPRKKHGTAGLTQQYTLHPSIGAGAFWWCSVVCSVHWLCLTPWWGAHAKRRAGHPQLPGGRHVV